MRGSHRPKTGKRLSARGLIDPRSQFGPSADKYLTSAVHSNPTALAHLVEIARPQGGVILDVATGAGHTAYAFAPYADLLIASDITPDMLRVTRNSSREKNLANIAPLFALAEDLPLSSRTLQGVTCRLGAHHFRDVTAFVREVSRVLGTNGWFLLVDTLGSEDSGADEQVDLLERVRDPSHVRNLKLSRWRTLLAESGFTIEHEETGRREIDAEDWMDRMRVSPVDRGFLRNFIENARDEFKNYLMPRSPNGKLTFDLLEIVLLARR